MPGGRRRPRHVDTATRKPDLNRPCPSRRGVSRTSSHPLVPDYLFSSVPGNGADDVQGVTAAFRSDRVTSPSRWTVDGFPSVTGLGGGLGPLLFVAFPTPSPPPHPGAVPQCAATPLAAVGPLGARTRRSGLVIVAGDLQQHARSSVFAPRRRDAPSAAERAGEGLVGTGRAARRGGWHGRSTASSCAVGSPEDRVRCTTSPASDHRAVLPPGSSANQLTCGMPTPASDHGRGLPSSMKTSSRTKVSLCPTTKPRTGYRATGTVWRSCAMSRRTITKRSRKAWVRHGGRIPTSRSPTPL
jgi:hypothetical protein